MPVAVGERLLKKQGWKEGEGLGAKAQGLRTPPDFGRLIELVQVLKPDTELGEARLSSRGILISTL
jgi:hypothetical protein